MMTIWVIVCLVGIIAVYDVYALIKGGFSNTISWIIYSNSLKYPVIPLIVGVLCGHLFWSQTC